MQQAPAAAPTATIATVPTTWTVPSTTSGLRGVTFDESSRKTDAKGNTKAIYLKDELAGFAVHW